MGKVCKLPAAEQSVVNVLLNRGWSPRRIAATLADDVSRVQIIRHRHHYDEGESELDEDKETA